MASHSEAQPTRAYTTAVPARAKVQWGDERNGAGVIEGRAVGEGGSAWLGKASAPHSPRSLPPPPRPTSHTTTGDGRRRPDCHTSHSPLRRRVTLRLCAHAPAMCNGA